MTAEWGRPTALWLMDHAFMVAGAALLVAGLAGPSWLTPAGWGALGLALLAGMAESEGYPIPRRGRTGILTVGGWEAPVAFGVSRRGRHFLFSRGVGPTGDDWPDEYTVYELPGLTEGQVQTTWTAPPAGARELEVRVPMTVLHFEHRGRSYVDTDSLSRALRHLDRPAA